jgi:vacuolar protein sorting-associated protein VTA1
MASNFVVPDTLKQVKPYMTLADQLDQKGDRTAAYYCRLHALQSAMDINKTAPDCKKFLLQLMDTLEKVTK